MFNYSLVDFRKLLDSGQCSATDLAKYCLQRAYDARELNAFISIDETATLKQAALADDRLRRGEKGNLLGLPIAHKDIFVTENWPTTAGSKILSNYYSPFDATVVRKLSHAGTVCIGKLNMDEFAMGSSNENSFFGSVKNPWNHHFTPGGSSGGSAAAVAARIVCASTASDTGGSIRQPASMCGVTGIKPTYGRISRYGMIAYASSFDQAGILAQTASDCAYLLQAIVGFDDNDVSTINRYTEDFSRFINQPWDRLHDSTVSKPLAGLKIGYPKEYFVDGLSEQVSIAVHLALKHYQELGADLVEISLPRTELSIPVYYVLVTAEAASNLARYDGVRYGFRAEGCSNLIDMYYKTRSQGFGEEVKCRILLGNFILSHGHYEAYYCQAKKIRRLIAQDFQNAFENCDFIMGPVSPTSAWRLGEKSQDSLAMYLSDIYTIGVNLAGLPAMSIPCGFDQDNLPIGLQIIGNYFDESRLLQVAHAFQNTSAWHKKVPMITSQIQVGFDEQVDCFLKTGANK